MNHTRSSQMTQGENAGRRGPPFPRPGPNVYSARTARLASYTRRLLAMYRALASLLATCAVLVVAVGADEPDPLAQARIRMVQRHLIERGIKDQRVLDAFRSVP